MLRKTDLSVARYKRAVGPNAAVRRQHVFDSAKKKRGQGKREGGNGGNDNDGGDSRQAVVHEDRSFRDTTEDESLPLVAHRGVALPSDPHVLLPIDKRSHKESTDTRTHAHTPARARVKLVL